MTGLELSRAYFEEYGLPMLKAGFSDRLNRIAVGLVGHGSECFGYDDEISRDHDFEPGFCIWLDDAADRDFGFRLFRAYSGLPEEFCGCRLQKKSFGGSGFKGVHTIKEFYSFYIGSENPPETIGHWLEIPDFYLAEATNGEVFYDGFGRFSEIRRSLLEDRPEDVRLKKLSSELFEMAQTGQYNYSRCLLHGEALAASAALSKFAEATARAVFLINRRYAPYYKWLFRGLRELPVLGNVELLLEKMLLSPNDTAKNTGIIEEISSLVISELISSGLARKSGDYLEPYAYEVKDRISDSELRNS